MDWIPDFFGGSGHGDHGHHAPVVSDPDNLTMDEYHEWCNNFHGLNPLTLGSRIICTPNSTVLTFSFVLICLFTIVIEFFLGCLETRWHNKKHLMAMLSKMYKELMMLGIISLCLGLIESVDVYKLIFADDKSHNIFMIFEFVHLVIFFLGCCYVVVVVIVQVSFVCFLYFSEYSRKELKITMCPFFVPIVFVKEKFALVQKKFVLINNLYSKFNFPQYVSELFQEEAHEIVEFSIRLVIAILCLCLVLFGLSFFNYGRISNGGVFYMFGAFLIVHIVVLVALPLCLFCPKSKYCQHLKKRRDCINRNFERLVKTEKNSEKGKKRQTIPEQVQLLLAATDKLTKTISETSLCDLDSEEIDSPLPSSYSSFEEGGEEIEMEEQSTDDSKKESEIEEDSENETTELDSSTDDIAKTAKTEEKEEKDDLELCKKDVPTKYFFFGQPKLTWWFLQATISFEACYLTFVVIYALPLILEENICGEVPIVKTISFIVALLPFILTMIILVSVIPDFLILSHVEDSTNWEFVKKVILERVQKESHGDVLKQAVLFARVLERIPKSKRQKMAGGHHSH